MLLPWYHISSPAMSASNKKEKIGQVVQNFYLKAANVIVQSRQTNGQGEQQEPPSIGGDKSAGKLNKWFNLNTNDLPREDLKPWKTGSVSSLPPLVVETYLDLRSLTPKHALLVKDEQGGTWNINTKKSEIVMERWLIELDRDVFTEEDAEEEDLPLVYKKLILTFRYLFVISRLLPCFKLMKKLNKANLTRVPLRVGARIMDGTKQIVSRGRIGLSKPMVTTSEDHLLKKYMSPVTTRLGALRISVTYRKHINFQISDNEESLSNHFQHIDKYKNTASVLKTFKLGQASPPTSVSSSTRNGSNGSIAQALKIQRSGSTGTTNNVNANSNNINSIPRSITSSVGSMGIPQHPQDVPISSGSTPKYSSSFGKIARRSSLRRSSLSSSKQPSPVDDDEINDFVRMLDNKSDLQLHYSNNVRDSLEKYQMLKSRNDLLTESMTASMYSKSHSPPPSIPAAGTPSSSLWPHRQTSGSPRSAYNYSIPMMPSKLSETTSSNESLPVRDKSGPISRAGSASPGSIFKRSGTKTFNIGPSTPTIASTQTHAKLHRTHQTGSIDSAQELPTATQGGDEEDDELLFTMSDMHIVK